MRRTHAYAVAAVASASVTLALAPPSIAANLTLTSKLLAPDAAQGDGFGSSVAVNGSTAVIGAPGDSDNGSIAGSAYVFVEVAGTWSFQQVVVPLDGTANHPFGTSVSISGDTLLIGAPPLDGTFGAAYVFIRSGSRWSLQQEFVASASQAGDQFGTAVAIAGDTAVVGASFDSTNGSGAGAAYIFVRTGSTWSLQQKILPANGRAGDSLGTSVALSGDTVLLGAPGASLNGASSGASYVFVRNAGSWSQQSEILPADGVTGNGFGAAVALDVNTAVIGSPQDGQDGTDSGSAYVYVRSGHNWAQQQKLLASDGAAFNSLGSAVAVSGETLLIGAPGVSDLGFDSGAVYVYALSGAKWSIQQKLQAMAAFSAYGGSVALSGVTAIAGAPGDIVLGVSSGSASAFRQVTPVPAVSGRTWMLAVVLSATALIWRSLRDRLRV